MVKHSNIGRDGQPTRVAFYTRISTDEDHQRYSLGAQSERLEAFCKSQYGDDWQHHKIYRDTESGTHMNRPGLEEMLFDAGAQAFDVLLVFRVDRLSRKVRELALMVDELETHGVVLKSITEPFDTSNAAGKMLLQLLGVFAEFEHATIVERTKLGMARKAKTGMWVGGVIPYGYQLDPEKGLVVTEDDAIVVRKIFQMYAIGRSGAHTICQKLNEAGYRKRSGRRWDKRAILHIIKNPLYVGKLRWRDAVYDATHNAIVSSVLFEKAQVLLKNRGESISARRIDNGDARLLSGLISCGLCKDRLVGVSTHKKGRKFPYYLCNKRWSTGECKQDYVRADYLEAAILGDIQAMLGDEQFIDRVRDEANRRLGAEKPAVEKEIAWLDNQIAKSHGTIERYFGAFENGSLEADICGGKIEDLKARLVGLEAEKRNLVTRRARLELPAIDQEMVKAFIANFDQLIAKGSNQQAKRLVRHVVKTVVVHDRTTAEVWYRTRSSAVDCRPEQLAAAISLQRHSGALSPAEIDGLVEEVADTIVTSLKGSATPTCENSTRKERWHEKEAQSIPA